MQGRLSTLLWATLFLAVVVSVEAVVVDSLLTKWAQGHSGKAVVLAVVALLLLSLCLVMLFSAGHAALSMLLPTVRAFSPNFTGNPGERVSFAWSFRRRPGRIRRFEVVLEGYEQRRKSTSRNENWKNQTIFKRTLFESESPSGFQDGQLSVELPEQANPTSMENLHRMRWVLHLQGEAQYLPNLKETFEIKVLPAQG
jgi:hypothetical protein